MRHIRTYGPSLVVLLTAAIVLLAGPNAVHRLTHAHTSARVMLAADRLASDNILEQINQAYIDIATFVEPSVVHISARRETTSTRHGRGEAVSHGSGWIYDDKGHIVTNHHVIADADRVEVQLHTGQRRMAIIVGYDRTTDIAVLRIDPARLHPAVRTNSGRQIEQGELVFAFGSPFDFRFSMSSGVVSGIGRSVGVLTDQFGQRIGFENFIQVDAAINPGNSGGPLTDFRGHVIGMNTAIATNARRDRSEEGQFSGVGLAIPMDMIEPVVEQLIRTGQVQKGYLGVSIVSRHDRIHQEYFSGGHFRGAVVARPPDPDSPIAGAIERSDVITHINGQEILDLNHWSLVVERLPAEHPVDVSILRFEHETNRSQRFRVSVPAGMTDSLAKLDVLSPNEDTVGNRLELLGFTRQGVVVTMAEFDGPARSAGLRRGDVITHVNDRPLREIAQLQSMITSMMPDEVAQLRVWRFDDELRLGQTLTIPVPLARYDSIRARGRLDRELYRDSIESLGIARMATATPELAEQFHAHFHPGVMLKELVPGSEMAGRFEPGSIIVRVMDQPVDSVESFLDALELVDLRGGAIIVVIDAAGGRTAFRLRVMP